MDKEGTWFNSIFINGEIYDICSDKRAKDQDSIGCVYSGHLIKSYMQVAGLGHGSGTDTMSSRMRLLCCGPYATSSTHMYATSLARDAQSFFGLNTDIIKSLFE